MSYKRKKLTIFRGLLRWEEEEATYMEQVQQEQSSQALEEEMPDGLFTTKESTTEVNFSSLPVCVL
jgi:hypothetical protein